MEFPSSLSPLRSHYVFMISMAMEAVLLSLVFLTPWAYGIVHPGFEFLLDAGIAVLLALWAARMLLERQVIWKKSFVAICLASLFFLGAWQRMPLSHPALAWLSPGTTRCYDELLPHQRESLSEETVKSSGELPAGSTLSLYPGATRREALRLLAVFLVFAVVYNNLTSKETLIRLSWVALINGVLLSLFALAQFFGAPPRTIYWTYPALATPFGPFICKNHFPDYLNMCIGLGIGLLLSQERCDPSSPSSEERNSLMQTWHNPRVLWICFALGLMVSAVAFSRSRGGLLALGGAALICGILGWRKLGRSFRFGSILWVAGLVLALSAWFGIDLLKERLTSLGSEEAYESRIPLWLRSLPIIKDFPIWGTGFGTYRYIEPKYRPDAPFEEQLVWYGHAHNDYLEILVEGGVVGFGLLVLALAAVVRLGYRAVVVNRGSRRAGLALGALFAFTALALHSLGDFGTHIPAITLLGIVVCAHLCELGRSKPHQQGRSNKDKEFALASASDPEEWENETLPDVYRLRFGGIAPALGAIAALGFGLVLCASGWKAHRIDRLQDAAFREGNASSDQLNAAHSERVSKANGTDNDQQRTTAEQLRVSVDQLRRRIDCLSEAVSLDPEDAPLHYELGSAHHRLGTLILVSGPSPDRDAALLEQSRLTLGEYCRARDACSLLSDAQRGIASFASRLKQGDAATDYIRRTKLLTPGQPLMWHLCGLLEFTLNQYESAWASWRHALELLPVELHQRPYRQQFLRDYLPQILIRTRNLKTEQLLEKVLPDSPDVLFAAALFLYPDDRSVWLSATLGQRPFLRKALTLLESKEEALETWELQLKLQICKALDQPDQVVESYRELLTRDRSKVHLRYEFGRYLYELHKLEEARRELEIVLAQNPKNNAAKTLLNTVVREQLEEKAPGGQRPRGGRIPR